MNKAFLLFWIFLLLFFAPLSAFCTPDLSLQTGNKCSKCHVNPQGGGIRTEFGWKFLRDGSHFPIGNEFVKKVYDLFDKEVYAKDLQIGDSIDGLTVPRSFAYGFDFRFQSIRSHRTEFAKRRYFPMEAGFYFLLKPTDWVSLNCQYNLGPIIFQGQDNWMASVNLRFAEYLPEVQMGKFQPSFGLRDCDMTKFDRRIASVDYSASLFPPEYSEFGLELSYRNLEMFDVFFGVFNSRFLSQVTVFGDIPIVVKYNPTFNLKFVFYPPISSDILTYSFFGSSLLKNGNFVYSSSFIGLNFFELFSVLSEVCYSDLKDFRRTLNFINRIYFTPFRGIVPFLAIENAKTTLKTTPRTSWELSNQSLILGLKYFPIPYIETSCEYRYFKSMESKSTRWAFQIHLYY